MIDQHKEQKGLSREFVIRSILAILDEAEKKKEWGSMMIQYQAGVCRFLKKEVTIIEERQI